VTLPAWLVFWRKLWRKAPPAVVPAVPADAAALAALHGAAFHRGWDETEFAEMLGRADTLVHVMRRGRAVVGFVASRIAADESEILSIALAAAERGRGLSGTLLRSHLGHLAGRGVKTVFLEVEEHNRPACALYARSGFRQVGRRERYYRDPSGAQTAALVLRRDLS
jgi:ribosomal-protein-alanine N-acetyltransferase